MIGYNKQQQKKKEEGHHNISKDVRYRKMKKGFLKFASTTLALLLSLGLTACSNSDDNGGSSNDSGNNNASNASDNNDTNNDSTDKKIVVGATAVPHADILDNAVKAVLAEEGWELETVIFQDYVLPNTSLEAGELDANYFQTLGYMNQQNDDNGLHLAAVIGVHIEPMGIYSQKYTSLDDLPDGASIGVPNDPDNEARGLNLLVQKGLLNSLGAYGTDDNVTAESLTNDAEANPHGYVITPLEAAMLPTALPDLGAAAINGNYALEADLPSTYPALDIEEFDADTTVSRTNFVVVKQGNEESEKTKALIAAIQSDEVKKYIEDNYKGSVISSFIQP